VLHSAFGDNDAENMIRLIASQINYGKEFFEEDKELSLEFSKLNMKAGNQALDGCDHKTAYSYLLTALSLLPLDHWESHYDFSLWLHFLMAGAANSSCQYEEADEKLQTIFEKARCLEDKLPSYLLQSQSECSIIIYLSQMSARV
jgi:predicted ATPase